MCCFCKLAVFYFYEMSASPHRADGTAVPTSHFDPRQDNQLTAACYREFQIRKTYFLQPAQTNMTAAFPLWNVLPYA